MKGTEKCQVYCNGLAMEECKSAEMVVVWKFTMSAVMVLHWKSDDGATEQHSSSGQCAAVRGACTGSVIYHLTLLQHFAGG
jgi:hypothetical protein